MTIKLTFLLGFKQPDGNDFVLAIPQEALSEIIMSLAHATEAFPAPKGLSVQNVLAMGTNWYEFGKDDKTGDFFLPFRLVGGGHLAFVMDRRRTAELIKYAANAFLATKITFINEIADLAEEVGADVQEIARGIGLDNRIGALWWLVLSERYQSAAQDCSRL